jgi:MFS family permease
MWGVIADKYGRRPALLYGLAGSAVAATLFGFSPSFLMAILARFLWGFLNGNVGVSKTYIAEILDDTNAAKGMALFGVVGGVGRFIGPLIGGYLSSPADQYKIFRHTVFDSYPFSLPSLVVAFNCLAILIFAYYELQETLRSKIQVQ